MYEPARVRSRTTRIGSSGCATRRSIQTKEARIATPAARLAIVIGSPQPLLSALENP